MTRNGGDGDNVLAFSGEVDIHSADQLAALIVRSVADTDGHLILDLAEVTFMDSRGLKLLLETRQLMEQQGRRLVIRNTPPKICRLFEMTGIGGLFDWS